MMPGLGIGLVMLIEEMVDFPHAALADGKACAGVIDGHVILVMHGDNALAEAAAVLKGFLWHIKTSFR